MTDFDINALPDDEWETLTSAGRDVLTHIDSGRFLAGDIANRCARRYGQASLKRFAGDIGMDRANTLYVYAQVAARYEPLTRIKYQELGLRFTHFRLALRAGKRAEEFLDAAADSGWPVAELDRRIKAALGKSVLPRKLYEGAGVVLRYADTSRPYLVLHDDVSALVQGQRVVVKVYAAETEAEAEAETTR